MNTLSITKVGVINTSKKQHRDFANKYLDYKRNEECRIVHELFKKGNITLATIMSTKLNTLINEQMHINN